MANLVLTKPRQGAGGGGATPGDLAISIINGQPTLTFLDDSRASSSPGMGKRLSVADHVISYSSSRLTLNDWIDIGGAMDADSGYIADFDGTVTFATAHCEDTKNNSKNIHLFINSTNEGSIGVLSGGTNATFIDTTLNIDFDRGDKIRLQAQQGSGGAIGDTVVKLTLKWRA